MNNNVFADAVKRWRDYDFAMIPLGGDEGKRSLVNWSQFKRGQSQKVRETLSSKHPNANVAMITGRFNGVTVVDIDDKSQISTIISRFGDTPLKIATPRGLHLYFKYNGERVQNLRSQGFNADIKGHGGYVVIPSSYNRKTGEPYSFEDGDLSLIASGVLPFMRAIEAERSNVPCGQASDKIQVGNRNDSLFSILLKQAKQVDDIETLIDVSETLRQNAIEHDPKHPFSKAEATAIAKSAWQFEKEGRNWSGAGQQIAMPAKLFDRCKEGKSFQYVATLYLYLRRYHNIGDIFAVSPAAIAKTALPFSQYTIRKARNLLIDYGVLTCIRVGGRGKNNPSLFRLNASI